MFAWEDGAILRLLRDPGAQQRNELQAAAIQAAGACGVRVPAVYGMTTALGRPGLIMERIQGLDLLTLVGRRPWTVFRAARIGGELHAQLHEVIAPAIAPPVRPLLRRHIESCGSLPAPLARFALDVLETLPDGDRVCHGDFHPGNIMMDGETPVLIDWTNVTRGDPMADVARTHLMLGLGEPPPGTSAGLRVMALVGRAILISLYLRSYRRQRPLDMDAMRRWKVPITAARFAEGIQEEPPRLIKFLEKARSSA